MNTQPSTLAKTDTVLFDLGGVLVHVRWAKAWRKVAKDCPGGQAAAMTRLLDLDLQVVKAYEAGLAGWGDVATWFREHTGSAASDEALRATWCSIFEPNEPMIRFAADLAAAHRIFYLSNIGREHLLYLQERFPFMEGFDGGAASCDLGVCKPEESFFERALARLQLEPEHCVFVDDREENVAAARNCGLTAVHHRKTRETITAVKKALGK